VVTHQKATSDNGIIKNLETSRYSSRELIFRENTPIKDSVTVTVTVTVTVVISSYFEYSSTTMNRSATTLFIIVATLCFVLEFEAKTIDPYKVTLLLTFFLFLSFLFGIGVL
jgi:hypothetical protein